MLSSLPINLRDVSGDMMGTIPWRLREGLKGICADRDLRAEGRVVMWIIFIPLVG